MKLKDISRLCAKSHEICICDMHGAQWLGDGHAMYPVFGVRNVYLEERYNMREADDFEEALTGVVLRFLHGGQLDAWQTESGRIVLIDPIYTKPYFADDAAEPTLYLRRRDNGDNYVIGCNIFDKLTLSGIAQSDATLDAMHEAEMEDDDDTGDD